MADGEVFIPSRRALLAAAGTLTLGFYAPLTGSSRAAEGDGTAFNAFIRIDRQGQVTLIMPQVEMGQGV